MAFLLCFSFKRKTVLVFAYGNIYDSSIDNETGWNDMNATQKFIEFATSKGFTAEQAEKILAVYKKARVIKFDKFMPQFEVKHGAFLEADVMRNALAD